MLRRTPLRRRPACKCGKPCAWYGPVGGYSVACLDCNRANATRQRAGRLRARSKTSKHARRERDWAYVAWVRSQPCIARLLAQGFGCEGPIQADHIGGRYGKDSDRRCVPMCRKHHEDRTGRVGGGGVFAGWPLERRRAWGAGVIAATLAAWEGRA